MANRPTSTRIPETLAWSLDDLTEKTGRKRSLLVSASLHSFPKVTKEEREKTMGTHLDADQKWCRMSEGN